MRGAFVTQNTSKINQMRGRYIINDQEATYFLTMTVVHWIDLFTRKEHKDTVVDSLNYCVSQKGLMLYGWVLMTNHLHLIAYVEKPHTMSGFLRDFKNFTSKACVAIIQTTYESRKEFLLDKFGFEAYITKRAENFKVWQDGNHPVLLENQTFLLQRLYYLHDNPVRQGIVENPEEYLYSSARDYFG
jgi:REP element-mobilizing transposase RayT